MNFTLLLTALLASMFTVSEPLPLGPGNPREELTTRCLAELLSRAFSKANASPLDPGCRDMLNAGLKHDAAKKNEEEVEDLQGIHRQTDEETRKHEEDGGHAGDGDPDVTKATENLLLDEEKRHHGLENLQTYAGDEEVASKQRSNHLLDTTGQEESEEEAHYLQRRYEEREKRMWKPTHRYHHNKHWSGEDSLQDREPEEADSASKEKQTWTPAHHSKHRRGEDSAEDDESEESDEVKFKQKRIWRPTHRTHHTTRNSNEDLDESEQLRFDNSEEDKSKERKRVWKPKHTLHHKMHRWSRESDQDRVWSPTSKLQYMKHRKNGVPSEEEEPEEMEIRAGKPWYSYQQKKHPGEESEEEDEDKKKRSWSHSYREKDQRRRRGDSSEVEESDEEKPERRLDGILELPYRRRDAEDHEGGNQPDEAEEERDEKLKSLRFLTQDSKEAGIPMEAELQEKGWPAVEKHYHPSWWKRAGKAKQQLEWWGQQAYPTHTMQELAKILQHKPDREYPRQGEDEKRRVRQRPLTPEEETELENLAAMDMELQKIAEKIQDQQE